MFKQSKIFLAIIAGVLIIGGVTYFSKGKISKKETEEKISTINQNCSNIPEMPDGASKLATKIIDGDTFLIEGGYSVRILGIDADERDNPCYEPAKRGLEELILNKKVRLERDREDKDRWCRYLRYVFLTPLDSEHLTGLEEQNVGLELVKEGMAVGRFSAENFKYREEIAKAEKTAKENKVGCKWSSFAKASEDKAEKKIEEKKISFQWEKLTSDLTGLKVISVCQAGDYYGKEVITEGKIASTYRSKTNTVFLNFEKPYPNQCFTSVIFSSDQDKFGETPEKYYSGKTVRIRGRIQEYQNKPEIILKDLSQIEVGK